MNFDLPQGCVANLAQLELFTTSTTGDEASYVTAHKMIEGWGETSTWNSMTPLQYDPAASFTITRSFLSADVTDDVNGWLAEPSTQNGWAFKNTGPDSYKFLTYLGAAEEAGKRYCEDSGFTEEQCMANDRNNDASSPCWCAWSDNEDAGRDECIWAGRFIEGGPQYAGCGAADGVIGRGPKLLLVAHDCPSTATPLATRTFSSLGCATESFEITSSVATELSPSGVLRDQLSSVAAHHPGFTHARFPRRHSGEPDTAHGDQEDIDVGVNEAITCAGQTSCYYGGSPCAADEFCNFDGGSYGSCEKCSDGDDCSRGLPSKGEADCEACCFGDQPSGTSQGLLKFDLGAIDGCDVIHAQLELHTISDTVGDAAKAYRLNGAVAWDASTTTWNSLSGPGGAIPSQYAADPSFTTDPTAAPSYLPTSRKTSRPGSRTRPTTRAGRSLVMTPTSGAS